MFHPIFTHYLTDITTLYKVIKVAMSRSPRDAATEVLTKRWLRAEATAKHAASVGKAIEDIDRYREDVRVKKGELLKHLRKVFSL